ncbi:MAG: hypothetical protein FRX49_08885 [Trebouxia sp. A1-2]|nr:MAG: hypothetical protein FRX49_08885 [Trebouxia sp. A1-2]
MVMTADILESDIQSYYVPLIAVPGRQVGHRGPGEEGGGGPNLHLQGIRRPGWNSLDLDAAGGQVAEEIV